MGQEFGKVQLDNFSASRGINSGVSWRRPHLEGPWLHSSTHMPRAWWAWLELHVHETSWHGSPRAVNPLHGGSGLPEEVFEETWVEAVELLMSLPQEF